jgi:hypothetical protein
MVEEKAGDLDAKEQPTSQVKDENETKVDFENKNENSEKDQPNNETNDENKNEASEEKVENQSAPINTNSTLNQSDRVFDNFIYSYTYILVLVFLLYLEFNRDLPYYLTYLSIISLVFCLFDLYQFEIQK